MFNYGDSVVYVGNSDTIKNGSVGVVEYVRIKECAVRFKNNRFRNNVDYALLRKNPIPTKQLAVGDTVKVKKALGLNDFFFGGGLAMVPIGSSGTVSRVWGAIVECDFDNGKTRWTLHADEIEAVKSFKVGERIKAIKMLKGDRYFYGGGESSTPIGTQGRVAQVGEYIRVNKDSGLDWSFHPDEISLCQFEQGQPVWALGQEARFLRSDGRFGVVILKNGIQVTVLLKDITYVEKNDSATESGAPLTKPVGVSDRKVPFPIMEKPKNAIEQEASEKGKKLALEQLVEAQVSRYSDDTKQYFNVMTNIVNYAKSAKKFEESLGITLSDQKKILGAENVELLQSLILVK